MMRRCIILTLKFPPQSDTAAQRPDAWAKYLHDEGVWPIIITKNYGSDIKKDVTHEVTDTYEVYRLNVPTTLFYQYKGKTKGIGKLKRKLAIYAYPWFITSYLFGPFKKMHAFTNKLLASEKGQGISMILATGKPFGLFKVAHRLSKKHGINWMADYRDDWTTTELPTSTVVRFLNKYRDNRLERKLLDSASAFSTVSTYYRDKISKVNFGKTPGYVIENGFFEEQFTEPVAMNDCLSFVYVGSLYVTQDIDSVVKTILEASKRCNDQKKIKIVFIGTNITEERKQSWIADYPNTSVEVSILPRMSKSEALQTQRACHYAIIIPHAGLKGIPSSKLYEFIGAKMKTIVFPNDHDVIFETLTKTGLGIFADDISHLTIKLENIISSFIPGKETDNIDDAAIENYTRRSTTKRLGEIIKKISRST